MVDDVAVGTVLQEPGAVQLFENPVHRGPGQSRPAGDLVQPQVLARFVEDVEDQGDPVHHRYGRVALFGARS